MQYHFQRLEITGERSWPLFPVTVFSFTFFSRWWLLCGREKPAFIVAHHDNGEVPSSHGVTIGFAAAVLAEVDAFHAVGLANGGIDEGASGLRSHLPGAYADYLRDPAGIKI